jgi:hypothetical protein
MPRAASHYTARLGTLAAACSLAIASPTRAQARDIDIGGIVLQISNAPTASVFHIVDQLSRWSKYTHMQYVRWAVREQLITPDDSVMLVRYAALRQSHDSANVFVRAFLVDLPIDSAVKRAVALRLLSPPVANEARDVLLHFAPKLEPLLRAQAPRIAALEDQLESSRTRFEPTIAKLRRLAGVDSVVRIPVFLVANPDTGSGGGEANGGRLVVEVPGPDVDAVIVHESLHAILRPHEAALRAAAESLGISRTLLEEAIAYAFAPGLTDDPLERDRLATLTVQRISAGQPSTDVYLQFYTTAMAIRPLVRAALERGETFDVFLPRVVAELRRLHLKSS